MKNNNKNMHFFAIAALAATLMAGQVQVSPVYAANRSVQLSSLIPDNVTVEEPVPLSDIALPDNEYGTLSWADSSSVPSERVQSYDVVFQPYDSSILSKISGWDGGSDVIYSSVTVVVSSITSDSEASEEWKEDPEENPEENYDDSETKNDENQDNYDQKQDSSAVKDEPDTDSKETKKEDDETIPEKSETAEETKIPEKSSEETDKEAVSEEDKKSDAEDSEETPEVTEIPDTTEPTETPEVTETPSATEPAETPEVTEIPEVTETPAADKDNIFDGADKEIKEDDRSTEYEENLTEEQKTELAKENHSCNGITVEGIDLPYYVQFRVASGDDYEFTNASEANVFQSYEFELWNLKNDTEYEVPDGEYVSVTVPVKAGYSYTIEHLLDSGAMETIVPSVDGSTMVFSTHSFSPFGIAGSKTLVGEEIEEDGYDTAAVTETPDSAQTANLTPVANTATSGTTTNTTASSNSGESEDKTDSSAVTSAPADSTAQTTSNSAVETEDNDESGSSSVEAVHTNDPTRILPFVILAAAAAAIVGVIVYLRKRKK